MKKYIYIFLLFFFASQANAHTSHYAGIKVINMEIFRDGEVIGYSNYFFEHEDKGMTVKNYTKFKVELLGVTVFSISSEAIEKYKNDKLISFKSNTFQNDKEKYVKLNYNDSSKKFIIDGSSYKGKAPLDHLLGTWWNHSIVEAEAQISAVSGRIIKQKVTFLGKETIKLGNKNYNTLHFNFSSTDKKLDKKKKLNTDVWYDEKNLNWVKASFVKNGKWEYRLKNIE